MFEIPSKVVDRFIHPVIAGLDPAIHPLQMTLAKGIDARVKPAHDAPDGL
jgi:hypothetical protein